MKHLNIIGPDALDWREVTINWDAVTQDIIKTGTPMSADGLIANDGTAYGILMDDVIRRRNKRGRVIISGCVDLEKAKASSGMELTDEAKAAMPDVWGQGGGVSSWDDLADRPFSDTRKTETVEITWDGNSEGKTVVSFPDGAFLCKVSDFVASNVADSTAKVANDSGSVSDVAVKYYPCSDDVAILAGSNGREYVWFVKKATAFDMMGNVVDFSEAGTYFTVDPDFFAVVGVVGTATTGELKQLDSKYIPEVTLTSPNGALFKLTVDDDGALSAEALEV